MFEGKISKDFLIRAAGLPSVLQHLTPDTDFTTHSITKREGVDLIIVTVSKQNVQYLQLHVICKNYYQSQHFTNNKGLLTCK